MMANIQHGNNLKVALFGAAVATVWRPEAVKWGTAPQHRCGVEDEEEEEEEEEEDDEITNLLLKHEKSNKQPAAVIPGDDSDSDNR